MAKNVLWRVPWRFLKKLKIELPNDPAIPLLGIYLDKMLIEKDPCTPVFIAARRWGRPQCPSAEEWMKESECMHTTEQHSAVKQRSNAIGSDMAGPRDDHAK